MPCNFPCGLFVIDNDRSFCIFFSGLEDTLLLLGTPPKKKPKANQHTTTTPTISAEQLEKKAAPSQDTTGPVDLILEYNPRVQLEVGGIIL